MTKRFASSFALGMSLFGATVAVPLEAKDHAYYVLRQPVVQFLKQLEQDAGVQIDLSSRIPGTIIETRVDGDPDAILDTLSRRFGFHWFIFNNIYYVSPSSESEMRLMRLNGISSEKARQALADAGLINSRFQVVEAAQSQALVMTGPPKLLALSEAIIETLVPEAPASETPAPTRTIVSQLPAPAGDVSPAEEDALLLYRGTSLSVIK